MTTSSDCEFSFGNRLYAEWLSFKSSETNKWGWVWTVLRDNIMFFFTSQQTVMENHIGTLNLSKEWSFQCGQGDVNDGFRFDLNAGKKKKKFKTKTKYEREVWKAYIEGVITGKVPQDVVLSPQDIEVINSKLQRRHQPTSPTTPISPISPSPISPTQRPLPSPASASRFAKYPQQSGPPLVHSKSSPDALSYSGSHLSGQHRRPSESSMVSTGTGSSGERDFDPPGQHSLASFSLDGSSRHSGDSGRESDYNGGSTYGHNFSRDGNDNPPSWFFNDCNRERAEKILTQCKEKGNTLMRFNRPAQNAGTYALSKRLERSGDISHYEVIRVANGYRINVQNCPKVMKTLAEVMEFFIQLSGTSSTHPMTCNNLHQLGIHYSDYSSFVATEDPSASLSTGNDSEDDEYEMPSDSPRTPPASSSSSSFSSMPPSSQPAPPLALPHTPPHSPPFAPSSRPSYKTWGKEKTEELNRYPQAHGGAGKTVGPAADRRPLRVDTTKPSVMQLDKQLQQRHEQDVVDNLDAVLRHEEQTSATARRASAAEQQDRPPPLPPVPDDRRRLGPQQSVYVNAASFNKMVSAAVSPPPMVKPSWGGETKVPPQTAPKATGPPKGLTMDPQAKAVPNIVAELQQKLQMRTPGQKPISHKPPGTEPQGSAGSPHHGNPHEQHQYEEDETDENYEDLEQYYQNCPN